MPETINNTPEYAGWKKHGITESTPDSILLGAGTIHRGFTFDSTTHKWNFLESLAGATSGGSKVTISPEIKPIELDGALVSVKGLDVKQGEVAKMETNIVEITPENLKTMLIAETVTSDVEGYNLIKSKASIEEGDYLENFAFVGRKINGEPVIIIFDHALCTSGLEIEGKNKDNSIVKMTIECRASTEESLETLPYRIYTPIVASNG